MVDKIVEERVRSVFYGNPIDFFVKDKGKLEFGKIFSDNCREAMSELAEIIARRNVYAHNDRRIDRKYVREVKNTTFKPGDLALVDDAYLGKALDIMIGIGAMSSCLVIEKFFKGDPLHGYVGHAYRQFQTRWWKPPSP